MANIKSAQKRARQAVKLRAHNMDLRSKLRTKIKNVINLIGQSNKEEANKAFKDAVISGNVLPIFIYDEPQPLS